MILFFDTWLRRKAKSSKIIRFFINRLKTSFVFWRFRHILHKNIWESYFRSFKDKRRNFYNKLAKEKSLKYFFEYGCSSAPNLMNIKSNLDYPIFLVGFDINRKAINTAKKYFNGSNSVFLSNLSPKLIKFILNKLNIEKFDLAIFDRVLYLLNENEVNNHFKKYSDFYDYILIDDFHHINVQTNGAYFTKDFIKILSRYNFSLVTLEKSEHKINGQFFDKYAKRILFRKNY